MILILAGVRCEGISQISELYADGLYLKFEYLFKKDSINIVINARNTNPYSLFIPSDGNASKPGFDVGNISNELTIRLGSDIRSGNYLSSVVRVSEMMPGEQILFDTTIARVNETKTTVFVDFIVGSDFESFKKEGLVWGNSIDGRRYYKSARMFRSVFYCLNLNHSKAKKKGMQR